MSFVTLIQTLIGLAGTKLLLTGEAFFNLREHHIYNSEEQRGRMDEF
jgi:hypothetical protein